MVMFNKNTATRNLKEIIKEDNSAINSIYRVYYENSDIPLFLDVFDKEYYYENSSYNLKYGLEDFHKLYLIPNYFPTKKEKILLPMQYSPKLKKAAEDIKKILKENDIAGVVILHTPGYGEYVLNLSPTYSCVKVSPQGEIRARAKLQEDFNGNEKEWEETVKNTSNMLSIIQNVGEPLMNGIAELSFKIDKAVNATHTKGNSTSDITQNN